MIRVKCPSCGSQLNAKDELAGHTRRCPKCKGPVTIPRPDAPPADAPAPSIGPVSAGPEPPGEPSSHEAIEIGLPAPDAPPRLDRTSRYLICNPQRVLAQWQNNGQGWMLKTPAGPLSARRNLEQVPVEGDFKLVELKLVTTDAGLRLQGITAYQLARRYSLSALAKGDDEILAKVTEHGHLNHQQKSAVRQELQQHLMREVWAEAAEALDFLAGPADGATGPG